MAANTAWHDDELAYLMDHGIAGYMERYPGYRSYDAVRVKHGVLRKGMGAASAAPSPRTESGTPPPYARGMGYTAPDDTTRSITPPTVTSITGVQAGERPDVEDAIERQRRQYQRIAKTHERKHQQHVYLSGGVVMLALFSDQHIGSPHSDISRMFDEQRMVMDTPGAYVALGGDVVDNYVIGKLAAQNMHHHVTVQEEWLIAKHYLSMFGDRMLWVHSGNHPAWSTRLIGVDIDRQITPDGVLYDTDEILVNLHVGPHSYLIRSRHKWSGNSIHNPTHGLERAARFDNAAPDIFIGGHVHKGALVRDFSLGGRRKTAILVGTYKGTHDTYARQEGFPASDGSTGAAIIFFPDGSWSGFSSISAACQVMRALYRGAA